MLVVVVLVLAEVHALASMQVCTVQQVLFNKLISLDGLIFFTCTWHTCARVNTSVRFSSSANTFLKTHF